MSKETEKKNRRKSATQAQLSLLEKFLQEVTGDCSYLGVFLFMLEVNKLESRYQKDDKPMIFLKRFDEVGVINGFDLNPTYNNQIPSPQDEFDVLALEAGLELIEQRPEDVEMLLTTNLIESGIFKGKTMEEMKELRPLILRQCDARGLPTAYKLNEVYSLSLIAENP